MRKVIILITLFFAFSLFAQEPTLVPIAPKKEEKKEEKKKEKKEPKKEEKKEEKKDGYKDLYQQYLNKYNSGTATEEKKTEEEPAAQPEAQPVAQPEAQPAAQPEAQPAAQPEAQPAAQPEAQPAPAPEPVKEEPEVVEPPKPVVPLDPFVVNPYFSVSTFMFVDNGIQIFGSEDLSTSWKFSLGNAILDLKGGNRIFNGRLLFDFAKGLSTEKVVVINYNHDPSLPTDSTNPVENIVPQNQPNALDIIQDASFSITHPSVRKGHWGMNFLMQAGKFYMPFGIESIYDSEAPFPTKSRLNDQFLGGGFNDLGLSLGLDFLLSNTMNLAFNIFVFNGGNETMLDGQDKFQDPALGFDLRFKTKGKFYSTFSFSLIWGSVYHDYDEDIAGGIFDTTNGTYRNDQNQVDENLVLKDDSTGRNDFALNKKNILFSIGTDLGYKVNENIKIGLMAEFDFSARQIFNPERIDEDGNTHIDADGILNSTDSGDKLRFLRDGSENFWGSSNYTTMGLFVAPYANIYMFDLLVRINYFKAPYLYRFLEDSSNSDLGLDVSLVYNFCDYASLGLSWYFAKEVIYKHDSAYNQAEGLDSWVYLKDTFNHNKVMLSLGFNFDYVWEQAKK